MNILILLAIIYFISNKKGRKKAAAAAKISPAQREKINRQKIYDFNTSVRFWRNVGSIARFIFK